MKLRYIKRIVKEDFPLKVQEWIDTLLYPLNLNIEQFNQLLAKNLTLSDNIQSATITLSVQGTSVLTGDTTAGSVAITNASYYQGTIGSTVYGVRAGLSIQGPGLPSGTLTTNVADSVVTVNQPCQYTQRGAEFIVGGSFPISFAHGLKTNPTTILITQISDQTTIKALQTRAYSPQWELSGSSIVIRAIPGLQAGRTYNITFLVL